MKRYRSLIMVFLLVLLFSSCKKEHVAPDTLTDFAWSMGQSPGRMERNVGEVFTFRDASVNALSREWTIEEGNYFLENGFYQNEDSLELFIDEEKGLKSTDHTAHVLLNNPGMNTINLRSTFKEKVTWYGMTDTIEAVKQGDVWVIDYTFEVDVYDIIQPSFSIVKDGIEILYFRTGAELLPEQEWDTLTIEGGSEIAFIDKTTVGRPSHRSWHFEGQATSNDSVARTKFYSMGVFNVAFDSRRQYPFPEANTSTPVPLHIKVVKSTKPFEFLSASRNDNKIAIQVSGELVDFSGQNSNFQVHVKNGAYNEIVEVTSSMVDVQNKIQINLELGSAIYDNDTVLVSYTGSEIVSIDERILNTFADEIASIEVDYNSRIGDANIFSFETEGTGRGGAEGWWTQNDPPNWERAAVPDAPDGGYAFWFHTQDYGAEGIVRVHGPSETYEFPLPEGLYLISLKIKHITGDLNTMYVASGNWDVKEEFVWDASNTSSWQTVEMQAVFTGDATKKVLLGVDPAYFPGAETHNEFYLDDLRYIPLSSRPE